MVHPTRGLILHIMQGTLDGTDAWFKNPASQASAHFGVGKDGRLLQWVDTADKAWAIAAGNRQWVSLECEGKVPDRLTPQQIAVAASLLAWLHTSDGVPLQATDDPNGGHGLGWHGMGGDAWGHPDCPGTNIIAQRGAIIAAAGGAVPPAAVVPVQPLAPPPDLTAFRQAHPLLRSGSSGAAVAHLRKLLFVPAGVDFDDGLARIVAAFQTSAGIGIDGVVGLETWAHLHAPVQNGDSGSAVIELQAALGIAADGVFGAVTQAAVVSFQEANGLTGDGIVGPQTYGALLGNG